MCITESTVTPNPFRVVNLYSGSKGNATYVCIGETEILIDAGGSCRSLSRSLCEIGSDLSRIKHIFITHEHTDHTSALKTLLKKFSPTVHISYASACRLLDILSDAEGRFLSCVAVHPPLFSVELDGACVRSFPLPHDSACCLGYLVQSGERKLYASATDMGFVTHEAEEALTGCLCVSVEANHDIEKLLSGPYPDFLKERILSDRGHLSNTSCASLVRRLLENGCERVLLSHLSEQNNDPALACSEVCLACRDQDREKILTASGKSATVLH